MAIRSSNKLNAKSVESVGDGFHSDGRSLYLKVADDGRRRSSVFRFVRVDGLRFRRRGVAQGGPLSEPRRNERANKKTFSECAEAYIAQHKGGWSASSLWSWTYATQPSLAKLRIDEITVKRAVAPVCDKGYLPPNSPQAHRGDVQLRPRFPRLACTTGGHSAVPSRLPHGRLAGWLR
jgi:hypothetical protein